MGPNFRSYVCLHTVLCAVLLYLLVLFIKVVLQHTVTLSVKCQIDCHSFPTYSDRLWAHSDLISDFLDVKHNVARSTHAGA